MSGAGCIGVRRQLVRLGVEMHIHASEPGISIAAVRKSDSVVLATKFLPRTMPRSAVDDACDQVGEDAWIELMAEAQRA